MEFGWKGLNVFVFPHTVADADFCENILRLSGIFLYFASDIRHINTKNLIVAVHIRSPDGIHNEFISQHFA